MDTKQGIIKESSRFYVSLAFDNYHYYDGEEEDEEG